MSCFPEENIAVSLVEQVWAHVILHSFTKLNKGSYRRIQGILPGMQYNFFSLLAGIKKTASSPSLKATLKYIYMLPLLQGNKNLILTGFILVQYVGSEWTLPWLNMQTQPYGRKELRGGTLCWGWRSFTAAGKGQWASPQTRQLPKILCLFTLS